MADGTEWPSDIAEFIAFENQAAPPKARLTIGTYSRELIGDYRFEVKETSDIDASVWFITLIQVKIVDLCQDAIVQVGSSAESSLVYVAGDPATSLSLLAVE